MKLGAQVNPDLCCFVMETISLGSQIEYNWSVIIVDLLRAEPRAGMAMLEALSGGEARRAALLAAAKSALPNEDFLLLQAVERAITPARRNRNGFAHHIWGASDEIANSLLLIDPAWLLEFEAQVAETSFRLSSGHPLGPIPEFNIESVQVWKKRDLEQNRKSTLEALTIVSVLGRALNTSRDPLSIDAKSRSELLKVPQVEQALQRLSMQSTLRVPPKSRGAKSPAKRR